MIEDVNDIKVALRILDAKYVSSKVVDNYAEIRFTYKNKNYILHINNFYKFMTLEIIDSICEMSIKDDVLSLIEDIRTIKSYLQFEDYPIFAILTDIKNEEGYITKKLQITIDDNNKDVVFHYETTLFQEVPTISSKIIQYNDGLNSFDERIFTNDWLEDFNEKVSTYTKEELYIMFSTLISYFNKVENNTWVGYKVDIFIIDYATQIILEELSNRNININEWYNNLSNYFDKDTLDKYLKTLEKRKELS